MKRFAAGLIASCVVSAGIAAAEVLPATGRLSKQSVERLLLIDAERQGNRVIAVGDRGYIIYTDDNGESWQRASTPAAPLLTAVHFVDQQTGWAVGHDSIILTSRDGGVTWTKQFSAEKEQRPLLDVLFLDKSVGFAVGAYGAFLETADGGKTWTPRKILQAPPAPPAPKGKPAAREEVADKAPDEDRHLNAIVKLKDGKLLIVGEGGTLARSEDAGKTWTRIPAPYKGSFFGAVQATDGSVLIYGLRGRVFRNADGALKDWQLVENASVATLMGSTVLPDGALALAGGAGTVLVSRNNGLSFAPLATGSTKGYSKVLLGAPNAVLLLGEAGARDVLLPSARP